MKGFLEKLKQIKEVFQTLWGNRRTRAMIILGVYFFLFLFLIMGIRMRGPVHYDTNQSKVTFDTMDNYEYDMTIKYRNSVLEKTYELSGTRDKDTHLLEMKGSLKPYYVRSDGIYEKGASGLVPIDIDFGMNLYQFSPQFLARLKDLATLESTVQYQESGNKYLYQVTLSDFVLLYEDEPLLDPVKGSVRILFYLYENDHMVEKVEMDLTPYYQLKDPETMTYMVNITYQNIGQVKKIEVLSEA